MCLTSVSGNRRALKICEPAVEQTDLQYGPQAVQQDLGAQLQNAKFERGILSNKQNAIRSKNKKGLFIFEPIFKDRFRKGCKTPSSDRKRFETRQCL